MRFDCWGEVAGLLSGVQKGGKFKFLVSNPQTRLILAEIFFISFYGQDWWIVFFYFKLRHYYAYIQEFCPCWPKVEMPFY